ncbi:MAG: hypothetical protein K6T78_12730 [Alicyclobacillus sp.]|nr:hypothetical protein [Alicyclobacillus sp.]
MLEALFFWALAVYGAVMVVWQSVRAIARRRSAAGPAHPVQIILLVQNVESSIEGLLRTLLASTAYSARRRTVCVIDVHSTDHTLEIAQRIAEDYGGMVCVSVHNEDEVAQQLRALCASSTAVCCVYDLRHFELLRDVTRDALSLLP